jgi:hypothetical protein
MEADARLRTVGGMSGLERLEVYNRQYWFRLITIFQEEYPCALHVIGLDTFNSWVIRYLDAHPPASPYLAEMDLGFPAFLRKRYRGLNRAQALEAAAYDKAFSRAFDGSDGAGDSETSPSGNSGSSASSVSTQWRLVSHVTPLWLHWNFTAYRAACREDEALTKRIPLRPRGGKNGFGLCVHRHGNTLYEKPVSRAEFLLLDALGKSRTLDQVFRTRRRARSRRWNGTSPFGSVTGRNWGGCREGESLRMNLWKLRITNYELRMKFRFDPFEGGDRLRSGMRPSSVQFVTPNS